MRAALLAGLALLGLALAADALFPPDLSRWRERSPVVVGEGNRLIRAFAAPDGRWRLATAPDAVDRRYRDLLLAYEDRRFHRHPGVDPLAMARAAGQLLAAGRIVSGASTITMQVARLLEPGPRGVPTKLRQMGRALQLEWRYTKDEILGLYLTLAPFGGNLEGVRAAALAWFGHPPDHLTLGEAALLVALPQSPERLRPDRHPQAAREGRDKVLNRLLAQGLLTAEQVADARAEPIPTARQPLPRHSPHLAERLVAAAPPGAVIATHLDASLQ
ncbi:MAG: transglycosylase domain-containing protein, partial [Alphaproteobacteria bacterium]|nr:transglycosylase domain-containing protein [Alphaproteobacteria bacterium]